MKLKEKTIVILKEDAYGELNESLKQEVKKVEFSQDMESQISSY